VKGTVALLDRVGVFFGCTDLLRADMLAIIVGSAQRSCFPAIRVDLPYNELKLILPMSFSSFDCQRNFFNWSNGRGRLMKRVNGELYRKPGPIDAYVSIALIILRIRDCNYVLKFH